MRRFLTACLITCQLTILGICHAGDSTPVEWLEVAESEVAHLGDRAIFPTRYRIMKLDRAKLESAWRKSSGDRTSAPFIVNLPHPDGGAREFSIVETQVMAPELAARYPQIRTFAGISVDGSGDRVWLDHTPAGFHAMIRGADEGWFIDPYSPQSSTDYLVYRPSSLEAKNKSFDFHPPIKRPALNDGHDKLIVATAKSRGSQLRTYRLAVTTTGEYSAFHGGTVAGAQAAVVTSINRVSGIFEDELAVRLQLVANNDQLIFTNAATDPYVNNDPDQMIDQAGPVINGAIGVNNYDIGHVFSTQGGGLAGFGVVCGNFKADGVTGIGTPTGDPFDVSYVAHEMGHQFRSEHSYDGVGDACGPERVDSAAYEPGSGSTIMGYAGICANDNLQFESDAYFHTHSFDEISAFVEGNGSQCGTTTNTGNRPPVPNGGVTGLTIPANTPFELTGAASDLDGDPIVYGWEQFDLRQGIQGAPVDTTSGNGPIFRSFPPSTNPTRTFPQFSDLVNNTQTKGEILPPADRSLTFRLTARDLRMGGGGVDNAVVNLSVEGSAGPFQVTSPNTAVTWTGGTSETVQWDVANTTAAPVSCAAVDILLSTDGGATFTTSLINGTPNDGSQTITVPDANSNQARVKVICSDNVFFDLSNTDFNINAGAPGFSLDLSPDAANVCAGDTAEFALTLTGIGGFSESVSLAVSGQSGTPSFSANNQVPPFNSVLSLNNVSAGTFTVLVTGTSNSLSRQDSANLEVAPQVTAGPTLTAPGAGENVSTLRPTFEWGAINGAADYLVEIDDQANFSSPLVSQVTSATSFTATADLPAFQTLNWRVTARNSCGSQASATRTFTTPPEGIACELFTSTDVPVAIPDPGMAASTLVIPGGGPITDIDVRNLRITHTFIGDLDVELVAPGGTAVEIMSRRCGGAENININLDDDVAAGDWTCPPVGGTFRPSFPLSSFDGQSRAGQWELRVTDSVSQDVGTIDNWQLQVCAGTLPDGVFSDGFE